MSVLYEIRPLIVIEGMAGDVQRKLALARKAARADGWTVMRGWAAPLTRERVVCHGAVNDADSARRALLAAVAGAGLVVHATAGREVLDRFVDDLRRLGPVEHSIAMAHTAELSARERSILALLGDGYSIAQAAAILGVSRRTVERRLSFARQILGTRTNSEAVVAAIKSHALTSSRPYARGQSGRRP